MRRIVILMVGLILASLVGGCSATTAANSLVSAAQEAATSLQSAATSFAVRELAVGTWGCVASSSDALVDWDQFDDQLKAQGLDPWTMPLGQFDAVVKVRGDGTWSRTYGNDPSGPIDQYVGTWSVDEAGHAQIDATEHVYDSELRDDTPAGAAVAGVPDSINGDVELDLVMRVLHDDRGSPDQSLQIAYAKDRVQYLPAQPPGDLKIKNNDGAWVCYRRGGTEPEPTILHLAPSEEAAASSSIPSPSDGLAAAAFDAAGLPPFDISTWEAALMKRWEDKSVLLRDLYVEEGLGAVAITTDPGMATDYGACGKWFDGQLGAALAYLNAGHQLKATERPVETLAPYYNWAEYEYLQALVPLLKQGKDMTAGQGIPCRSDSYTVRSVTVKGDEIFASLGGISVTELAGNPSGFRDVYAKPYLDVGVCDTGAYLASGGMPFSGSWVEPISKGSSDPVAIQIDRDYQLAVQDAELPYIVEMVC